MKTLLVSSAVILVGAGAFASAQALPLAKAPVAIEAAGPVVAGDAVVEQARWWFGRRWFGGGRRGYGRGYRRY